MLISVSGALLALVVSLERATRQIRKLIMIAPSLDNSIGAPERWKKFDYAPWPVPKMIQYYQETAFRNHNRRQWWISPIYASSEILRRAEFMILIRVMEVDILRQESIEFATRLADVGCHYDFKTFLGHPHTAWVLQGRHDELLLHIVKDVQQ